MDEPARIPAEIIQQFSASQARHYGLVPYRKGGKLDCYGEQGRDYSETAQEIEVLHDLPVEITPVPSGELARLLDRYYRLNGPGEKSGGLSSLDQSEIGSGPEFFIRLVGEAFGNYASDIHLEPSGTRCRIRFRIDGRLIEKYILEKGRYASLVNQIKIMANLDISEKRLPQDGRILYERNGNKFDVRVSSLPTLYGEKIVLRLLTRHAELLELENLGFTPRQMEDYRRAVAGPHGLVLISGPTGSGKSTTLYATLRLLNRESNNILTIEDPVEYTLEGINQVQLKEEIGLTFSAALRTFLRQDPDIIMLGEIRDGETAQMAVRSSLTGHLLLSTLHTNSAWGCISRLTDMGVHPYLISNTLIVCVAQRLVRLLCPRCKQSCTSLEITRSGLFPTVSSLSCATPASGFSQSVSSSGPVSMTAGYKPGTCGSPQKHAATGTLHPEETWYRPAGCEHCYYTGYKGRKAVYEVIPIDGPLAEAIRASRSDIATLLRERGLTTLRDAALTLLRNGDTSPEEVLPLIEESF